MENSDQVDTLAMDFFILLLQDKSIEVGNQAFDLNDFITDTDFDSTFFASMLDSNCGMFRKKNREKLLEWCTEKAGEAIARQK